MSKSSPGVGLAAVQATRPAGNGVTRLYWPRHIFASEERSAEALVNSLHSTPSCLASAMRAVWRGRFNDHRKILPLLLSLNRCAAGFGQQTKRDPVDGPGRGHLARHHSAAPFAARHRVGRAQGPEMHSFERNARLSCRGPIGWTSSMPIGRGSVPSSMKIALRWIITAVSTSNPTATNCAPAAA